MPHLKMQNVIFAIEKQSQSLGLSKQMCIWRDSSIIFRKLCFLKCLFTCTEERIPVDHLLPEKKKMYVIDSEFFMKLLIFPVLELISIHGEGYERNSRGLLPSRGRCSEVSISTLSCFPCLLSSVALWMNQSFRLTEDLISKKMCEESQK